MICGAFLSEKTDTTAILKLLKLLAEKGAGHRLFRSTRFPGVHLRPAHRRYRIEMPFVVMNMEHKPPDGLAIIRGFYYAWLCIR